MDHAMSARGIAAESTFDVPPDQIVQSSLNRDWQGLDIAEVVHPRDDFALPPIARHMLVVNLSEPTELVERRVGRRGHLGIGSSVILPAHVPTNWHLEHEGEARHLHLYLPQHLLGRIAAEADLNPDRVSLIDAMGVHDPQIETIAHSLFTELRAEGLGGKIYIEALTNLLAVHLLRNYTSARPPLVSKSTALPPATIRRVLAYIDERLAEELSLAELAALASLSPYHFARLFKGSLGLSPHQYIIRRRVERAKSLLATTSLPVTVIAHTVGFASESHLALHFKRHTGLTPAQFR